MPKEINWTEKLPPCDFCSLPAAYDGKTQMGPWANMCGGHLNSHGYPASNDLTFKRIPNER